MRNVSASLLQAEEIRRLMEVEGLSQPEVSKRLGIPASTLERWCPRLGIRRDLSKARSGPGNPCWRGGRKMIGGYWYVYSPNHPNRTKQNQVSEHRLAMETKLGRYLDREEVVHHIDGDIQNNALENLEVFSSNAEHLRKDLAGQVPRWSEAGKARIAEGVRLAAAIHRLSKSDDDLHILSIARLPSLVDSSDVDQAS